MIEELVREYERTSDSIFRDPNAPFYWVAARLWLVIALDRISEEKPEIISDLGSKLYEIAVNNEFPHALIKDFARDAALKLNKSEHFSATTDELLQLNKVNKGMKSRIKRHFSDIPSFDIDLGKRRFDFDTLDTLRYWYQPWLNLFDDLSAEDFLDKAESWIIDKWDNEDEKTFGTRKAQTKRFTEPNWKLAFHSHGSLPTLEHHRTYLEWHAMWCSVGEILKTHRITLDEYNDTDQDELKYRFSQGKLTHPPIWLADLCLPCPLQKKRWYQPNPPSVDWFEKINDNEFLEELLPSDRSNYLIVHAAIYDHWGKFGDNIRISSNLISPETASSLMRALQCKVSETDYYFGPESGKLDINDGNFQLQGWLQFFDVDSGLDYKDSLCNQISEIAVMPGLCVTNCLGLKSSYSPYPIWFKKGDSEPSFIYEVWGKHELDRRLLHDSNDVVSFGHRLLARTDVLSDFLDAEEFDLIVEVGVNRHERGHRQNLSGSENTKEASFDRIFLLRRNGKIEGAERDFGSWRENCQRT